MVKFISNYFVLFDAAVTGIVFLIQVQCMIQGAQGWCASMTLRDGMGRDVGGGNTCTPVAHYHVNV